MKLLIIIFLFINIAFAKNQFISAYSASFKQIITNPNGQNVVYDGDLFIKQPNKMLWKYELPVKKYVYMNGINIIIDEPELEQAIFSQMTDEINIIKLINNPTKVDKKYKLTFKNKVLTKITYQDDLENEVTIFFTNIKINSQINDKIFKFNAPNDYDIIRK